MDYFNYKDNELYVEELAVTEIATKFGTPCYIYSQATLLRHWHVFNDSLGEHPHRICYAVKANSNLAILKLFADLGSSFDIVSGGELERVLHAGGHADHIVFSGVGKTVAEIERALEVGILCFNIESVAELQRIETIAQSHGVKAPISLRVNPNVDPQTHPYIATGLQENKFGIDEKAALKHYREAAQSNDLNVIGVDCHIGSQLLTLTPFLDALDCLLKLVDTLHEEGIPLHHIDIGGGLGVRYDAEAPPEPAAYATAVRERLAGRNLEIWLEPGRAIAGNAGILVTRIEYLKPTAHKHFAIVDAAMNDLIRPALYQAYHDIIPVKLRQDIPSEAYDIVGPVCETGDFLGKDRSLAITSADLLAVRTAGAYGFVLSSNYNTRPRAAEILVNNDQARLIRRRETVQDLLELEQFSS